jgi:polyribonucleotide nucleotidyltransferase
MNTVKTFEAMLGDAKIVVETGKLAGQAGGAVTVRCGDTIILATATAAQKPRADASFFPLAVDYEERLYAAGKIPGGFFKREGRPTEEATLLCRLVDRPLRPLFPKGMLNDVQIMVTALSTDQENYLDILAIIGASAALTVSDIPFNGPVGAIRMGYADGKLLVNPTTSQMLTSALNLRIAGTSDSVIMVEAGANEVSEDIIVQALEEGHRAFQGVIRMQETMRVELGKPKREFPLFKVPPEAAQAVLEKLGDRVSTALAAGTKEQRNQMLNELRSEVVTGLGATHPEMELTSAFDDHVKKLVRAAVLDRGYRPDGRALKTIRPITCEVGLLPRTHGSGLFTRGETQVLTIATLGTSSDEQIIDGLGTEDTKRYMHHYNFPPYSTGETSRPRGPGRREIGHGALAERALVPMLPTQEQFPYTIRLVSEVLSSNGSTSMASVCASTLALMDAGVPIKSPVAGIAMGLIKEGDRVAVLTDIQGMEDYLGDMDFKVAGTAQGVTALQMDLKVKGIAPDVMRTALAQAKEARLFVLDKILGTIQAARPELSPFAPRITLIKIDPQKIGAVIGPGGKMIRKIIEQTGAKIDVEDDGTVFVASTDKEASDKAVAMIRLLTEVPEIGKTYVGKVVRITDFGAFVEILPGTDGLVHISQLADFRVGKVEDVVKLGDEIMVMIIDIDPEGKIRLSRSAVLEGLTAEQARERDQRNRGSGGSGPRPFRPRGSGDGRSDSGRGDSRPRR